jgi:hypothetical protein
VSKQHAVSRYDDLLIFGELFVYVAAMNEALAGDYRLEVRGCRDFEGLLSVQVEMRQLFGLADAGSEVVLF